MLKVNDGNVDPLPDDKILALSKLKAFADDKINVTQNINFVFHRLKKALWEKEKILVTSIFSLFHNVFKRPFSHGHQKSPLCGKGLHMSGIRRKQSKYVSRGSLEKWCATRKRTLPLPWYCLIYFSPFSPEEFKTVCFSYSCCLETCHFLF